MQTDKHHASVSHKNSNPHSRLLEIERKFYVPVEKLFQAFSTSDAIKAWWWPKELYTDKVDYDFREGGKYYINMKGNAPMGGGGMTGVFEEIVENKRIVMTDGFADEKGKEISAKEAKMPGEWPKQCYITFEFEVVGPDQSRFKLSQQGIPNELQTDCVQGWSESFDKLESYLSDQRQ